ncbi:carboxylate--amine ligase [Nesterenkonia populi]|uniref:carboxylate--amine ligase n=1 Tax=Nesterenkonia populi TaxID=1591087 RepID=UPI0011BF0FBC|nr:carboxylate--amine ligase [Nesterenkonia populi]
MSPKSSPEFTPVIIGTDLNAYHMATAFYEGFGIRPHVIGKVNLGFTGYSSIIASTTLVDSLDDAEVFLPALLEFAAAHEDADPLLLVGTSDHYVRLIIENAESLSPHYRFNCPSMELLDTLQWKELFYPFAQKHGLPIPETHFHSVGEPLTAEISDFPVIVKPSDPVQYNRTAFEGQEKVYRVSSHEELAAVVEKIEASGYRAPIIIQDFIPGGDTSLYESDLYLHTSGKAEFVNLAQVVLQEHEPTAIGNFASVISRYDRDAMTLMKSFLEEIGYTGLANFDLKWDERDGSFKILEVNIRQGRSSDHATAQGHNLAGYLVEDLIRGRQPSECVFVEERRLYTLVPRSILKKYTNDPKVLADVDQMYRQKKVHRPMIAQGERSLKRRAWAAVRAVRYRKKYAEATWAKGL